MASKSARIESDEGSSYRVGDDGWFPVYVGSRFQPAMVQYVGPESGAGSRVKGSASRDQPPVSGDGRNGSVLEVLAVRRVHVAADIRKVKDLSMETPRLKQMHEGRIFSVEEKDGMFVFMEACDRNFAVTLDAGGVRALAHELWALVVRYEMGARGL